MAQKHLLPISAAVVALFLSGCTCATPGVSCRTEADCTIPGSMRCDSEAMLCVQCVSDEHCEAGFVCNGGTCEAGCRSEDDRCVGAMCRPGIGCVECVLDAHCLAGQTCNIGTCVNGCSAANPTCPSGQVCDTAAGQCVECTTNSQCNNAPLNICNPATNECVQCVTGTDCRDPNRPVCDPASNTCVGCLSNTDCPNGVCVQNQCVQCTSDSQCGGTTPRCNLGTNTCVACLPGATDNCPTGQYCRPDFTCEQGCKTGTDCPSGVCLPNHSCQMCTQDSQCAAGNVCNNGTCVGACSATAPCGAGETCCNGRCESLQNDADNCGACGVACGTNKACCAGACRDTTATNNCGACGVTCTADQFCDGSQCRDKTFPNFCANQNVVALRDGQPLDNAATTVLASTITQYCSSSTQIAFADDDDPTVVEQRPPLQPDGGPALDAGQPGRLLLGGSYTVVTAGGPFPNLPVNWLERNKKVTKVYFSNNVNGTEFYFKQRLNDGGVDPIVVQRAQSECGPSDGGVYLADGGMGSRGRDVFLVELAIDPASGTLALISYGLCSPGNGTQAAAWYWANVMLPNRMAYTDEWYIYEWRDTNGDFTPDITDQYTRLASGR